MAGISGSLGDELLTERREEAKRETSGYTAFILDVLAVLAYLQQEPGMHTVRDAQQRFHVGIESNGRSHGGADGKSIFHVGG